jgi:glycosyltransferase involved in cell wall biosynthesis
MKRQVEEPIRVMRIIARMNVGGPAVQVSGLMKGFDCTAFEQRLYTGFCADDEADYLKMVETEIGAYYIPGFGRRVNFSSDVKALSALVIAIREFKPHIIHTHTAKAGFLGRIASVISLQPAIRVHTFHGHLLKGYFGRFKTSLIVIAEKALAIFTHQLLAVGDNVRLDLLRVGIGNLNKFGLMPPGLAIGKLPPKQISQERLGLPIGHLQCAFIGRITQIKRPDRFLDVVSEVKKRGLGLHFFMAGDGELLETCRSRIERYQLPVTVLGWQGNIEEVLAACDIVILTSDNEGTPLSLIQAGMAGIPTVATKVGSVSEVILDGVTGLLTSLEIHDIADSLENLISREHVRQQFGAAAKEFTLASFSVEKLVQKHEELYRKLLSNPAKI